MLNQLRMRNSTNRRDILRVRKMDRETTKEGKTLKVREREERGRGRAKGQLNVPRINATGAGKSESVGHLVARNAAPPQKKKEAKKKALRTFHSLTLMES